VAIDTFTIWIEAEPVINIMQGTTVKFLKKIIFRFGVPRWVLMDNDTQFKSKEFKPCCTDVTSHVTKSLISFIRLLNQALMQ
jgi:hypothetical protein